jgi:hypothetical protein
MTYFNIILLYTESLEAVSFLEAAEWFIRLYFSCRATCPYNPITDLIIPVISYEEYKLRSSSSCNFLQSMHPKYLP